MSSNSYIKPQLKSYKVKYMMYRGFPMVLQGLNLYQCPRAKVMLHKAQNSWALAKENHKKLK